MAEMGKEELPEESKLACQPLKALLRRCQRRSTAPENSELKPGRKNSQVLHSYPLTDTCHFAGLEHGGASEVAPSLEEPELSRVGVLGSAVVINMAAIVCSCPTFLTSKSHNNRVIKVVCLFHVQWM